MKRQIIGLLGIVMLAGCAGQPQTYYMQQPGEQSPQAMTFPNGTMFGGASNRQASSLAQDYDRPTTII
jgi:uncharacterized lipoprotein YajG